MIPYDIDPSLHTATPERIRLDDGFAAPCRQGESSDPALAEFASRLEEALTAKSDF